MKKFFSLLLIVLLGVFVLSACAPVRNGFVSLPDDVKTGIGSLVLVAVSWLFARLITLIPWLAFLDEYRVPFAMGIAMALVNYIQNAVPDAFGDIAVLALKLVLAVLALFLTFEKLKQKQYRLFM